MDNKKMANKKCTWIHCNNCFMLYRKKTAKFYFTSCLHVFCASCLTKAQINDAWMCSICKKTIAIKAIDENLAPIYRVYFHPRPWEVPNKFLQIIPFQIKQRQSLARVLVATGPKLKESREELKDLKHKIAFVYEKRNALRAERVLLEQKLQKLKSKMQGQKTPSFTPLSSMSRQSTNTTDSGFGGRAHL